MDRSFPIALAVAGVLLSACTKQQAAAQQSKPPSRQFDLQCQGTQQRDGLPAEPYASHLKVDLDAGLWCRDACESVYKISRTDPGEIVLGETEYDSITVNRVNGHFAEIFSMGRGGIAVFAECTPTAYSGLPETKF
jgi:hypothetical protein